MKNKKILCLIPARGGSKEIKNKNLLPLKSKPLIYWSIKLAKKIKFFDRVVVSTDSLKIKSVAEKFGAEVPFIRPKKISKSQTPMIDVINHCILFYKKKNIKFDAITLFQPTSPFRKKKTVENSIKKFFKNKLDTLFSVERIKHNHNPYYLFSDKKELKKRIKKFRKKPIRQKEKKYYGMDGGAIFMFKSQYKLKRIFGNKFDFVKVSKFEAIDIDTKEDLNLAKSIKFKIS